jgi:hypothetical protein
VNTIIQTMSQEDLKSVEATESSSCKTRSKHVPLSTVPQNIEATVAIIGPAGRGQDGDRMSLDVYKQMISACKRAITDDLGLVANQVHLVSGGAAWADHVAVELFLAGDVAGLTLHLPCKFVNGRFEKGDSSVLKSPGRISNELHGFFSAMLGRNTLTDIKKAISRGAYRLVHDGFPARNCKVATASHMIAMTWASGQEPGRGSTLETWKRWRGVRRVHLSLTKLNVLK